MSEPTLAKLSRRFRDTPRKMALWALTVAAVGAVWFAFGAVTALNIGANADTQLKLQALAVDQPPTLDGELDTIWRQAPVCLVPMRRGRGGSATSLALELRAVYTPNHVYFCAQWPEVAPVFDGWGDRNRFILHFTIEPPWDGAADLMCLTACHTAYVDENGQAQYVSAETIPPGLTDPLPVGGRWRDGIWSFEWGRPLVSGNPFDVQFDDLDGEHAFFCKVVEGVPNVADPVSDDMLLVFLHAP